MPVPFGFSIGDFLAAGELIHRINAGLKDVGGAKSEYKNLAKTLDSIGRVLRIMSIIFQRVELVQQIDNTFFNSLRHEIRTCQDLMEEFLESSEKYSKALLASTPGINLKLVWSKVTWTLSYRSEDVRKLHENRRAHFAVIQFYSDQAVLMCIASVGEFQQEALKDGKSIKKMVKHNEGTINRIEAQFSAKYNQMESALQQMATHLARETSQSLRPEISTHEQLIQLEDFLGRLIPIPLILCRTQDVLHELLKIIFQNITGETSVIENQYEIVTEDGLRICEWNWVERVVPGSSIAMNALRRVICTEAADPRKCPKCNVSNSSDATRNAVKCVHCQSVFRITEHRTLQVPVGALSKRRQKILPDIHALRRIHYLCEVVEMPNDKEFEKAAATLSDISTGEPGTDLMDQMLPAIFAAVLAAVLGMYFQSRETHQEDSAGEELDRDIEKPIPKYTKLKDSEPASKNPELEPKEPKPAYRNPRLWIAGLAHLYTEWVQDRERRVQTNNQNVKTHRGWNDLDAGLWYEADQNTHVAGEGGGMPLGIGR